MNLSDQNQNKETEVFGLPTPLSLSEDDRESSSVSDLSRGEKMTRREARRYIWNALLAALLIALVISVTWVLFTLFATKIWLR